LSVVRRVVVEKATVRRYLRHIASQTEGFLVQASTDQTLAILDRSAVSWMAYRSGALRLIGEPDGTTRIVASSSDLLDAAREVIERCTK